MAALLVGEKSAVYKLSRRADWVHRHVPLALRHFGLPDDPNAWRVLAVVVTSRNLLSPHVLQTNIPVLALPDLPRWVSEQAPRRCRRSPRG